MWTPGQSHGEEAARVAALGQLCIDLRNQLGLPDSDARTVVLNNVQGAAESVVAQLNLLHAWVTSPGKEIIPSLLGVALPLTQQRVDVVGNFMRKLSQLGFLFVAQSQIENGLRNVLRGLSTAKPPFSYYAIVTELGTRLGLTAAQRDVLRVPAEIRNSLHNNGIFHGYKGLDFVAQVHGVKFELRHDHPVRCSSMSHLALAFSAAIEVFVDVCRTPAVQAIQAPLMDHYVWDQLTEP